MRLISYLDKEADIKVFSQSGISELILSCKDLSRTGHLDVSELQHLAEKCTKAKIKPILEWDILMTEEMFQDVIPIFENLDLSLFGSVRLQDPGAVEYVMRNYPQLPIQLLLESGNHNLLAIESWVKILGEQLERLVLSIQLTHRKLAEYASKVRVPIEVLGLGRILLFYSPRKLLSHQAEIHNMDLASEFKTALASSEEGRHKKFRVIENRQGTFLFHSKNHCLLDKVPDLDAIGIDSLRIELRFDGDLSFLELISQLVFNPEADQFTLFKETYPVALMKSFYRSNKTDAAFSRLKNREFSRLDDTYLGEVVESKRGSATIIVIKHPNRVLTEGQSIEILSSLGKKTLVRAYDMKNSNLESIQVASQDQIVILPYIKSAAAKSRVTIPSAPC